MAIIDINSDLPKSCSKCKDPRCNIWWKVNSNENLSVTRHKDCPLKSADEMFERIEKSLKFWGKDARVVGEVLAILDDYKEGV